MPRHARPRISAATTLSLLRGLFALSTALRARAAPVVFDLSRGQGALGFSNQATERRGWTRVAGEVGMEFVKRQVEGGGGAAEVVGHKEFILKLVFSIVFVLLGGVFSGLSLGLMGLDQTNLQVLATSGPPADRRDAQKVLKLLSHGRHFVLCTLLLSNVVVNETLPVFLDTLTGGGGLAAVLISSALIVIFGEVLPQALCAQYELRVGARCVGFVRVLMYLESPINYPVAKLLDLLLGSRTSTLYRREELKTLISLHSTSSPLLHDSSTNGYTPVDGGESSDGGGLGEMEVELVHSVLGLAEQTAQDAVTAMREGGRREAYCLQDGMRLCDVDLQEILLTGRTYIPVKRSPNWRGGKEKGEEPFMGYLPVAQIVHALSRPNELVRSVPWSPLVQVRPSTSMIDCIAYLKKENPSAILLVSDVGESPSSLAILCGTDFRDEQDETSASAPAGFLSLAELSCFALSSPTSAQSPSSAPFVSRQTARASLPQARTRSSSIGLGRFVQDIVDSQFMHAQEKARGHRASSSQLSFRLSSSEEEDNDPAKRPIIAHSHSHHRSTSSLHSIVHSHRGNFRPSAALPSTDPLSAREGGPASGGPFRFPSTSPVSEETDTFSLGSGETDEEDGRLSVSSLRARGEADDSGFGEAGEVERRSMLIPYFGSGTARGGLDPLGVEVACGNGS
ncbi:hypothetical protein JCM11251_005959 [Rhodosporidiobolus azoricus]